MPTLSELAAQMNGTPLPTPTETIAHEVTKADQPKQRMAVAAGQIGTWLGLGLPGGWASDHRAESDRYEGWHYVAINAIRKQCANANAFVYQGGGGAKRKAYQNDEEEGELLGNDHPLTILLKRPNPYQPGSQFRGERAIQLCLTGKTLIWNVKNALGMTVERYVIPTAIAEPTMPTSDLPRGGWRIRPEAARYAVSQGWYMPTALASVMGRIIPAEDIQVDLWPHPVFKDDSQSPVSAGAVWTDTSNKIDVSRSAAMDNGVDPSIIIQPMPGVEYDAEDLKRAQERLDSQYAGPSKKKKAMIVTGQATPISNAPDEMDYGTGFEQMRDAIFALHGVTPIAAGISAPSGRDGLYAPLLSFIELTIQPILNDMSEWDTLAIGEEHGDDITIEYVAKGIRDKQEDEDELKTDIYAGAITRDEVRVKRGREPWGGEKGEQIAGMADGGGAPKEPQVPTMEPTMPSMDGPDINARMSPRAKRLYRSGLKGCVH